MANHVIVGGGPGGMNAIETIRGYDSEASITLICDEPTYARMALPYFISGDVSEDHVLTGDNDHFSKLGVTTKIGSRVTSVDPGANSLTLDDGSTLSYDNLLIATGSSPQKLNIPGADGDGVYNLWTIDDARKATADLNGDAEVAFIGAGFIGFIILNAVHKIGAKAHVIELDGQVLPRMLDPQGASLVDSWLDRQGVSVSTGVSVQSIDHGADGKKTLNMSDGSTISADLVIIATGITANIGFLDGTGIAMNQGILVNSRCQTNHANIYAAGDVAEGPDRSTGKNAVHAIHPTAVDHGRVAGANMAGQDIEYGGSLSMNILDVCGLQCASFGVWKEDSEEVTTVVNATRPVYRKLVWSGNTLVGAIMIGPADDMSMLNDMGMVKGLIQAGTDLGAWKNHIVANPTDIRRPYVATKTASRLLENTVLGKPAAYRDYQASTASTKSWENRDLLVGSKGG